MKSKVFFTKDISAAGVEKAYRALWPERPLPFQENKKMAVKLHFGEPGNQCLLNPKLILPLAKKLNATLIDSNVLYAGPRRETASHYQVAKDHGYGSCPIDILDGEEEIKIPGVGLFKEVLVGSHLPQYDELLVYSHVKGHIMNGMGAAMKNVAMGLASVSGKMAQHSSVLPTTEPAKCKACGKCVGQCSQQAISIKPLKIDAQKCIGCGKCVGVCQFGAIDVDWGAMTIPKFQERLACYAAAIYRFRPMSFINVLANITSLCDCCAEVPPPFVKDIGILASHDMIAIDQASYDLVDKNAKCQDAFAEKANVTGHYAIDHAAQIKIGSKEYQLVSLD